MNNKQDNKDVVFVVYDGIANSVFQSQVLAPLIKKINDGSYTNVTLVSFEKHRPSDDTINKLIPAHNRFHFVIGRKLPFWGPSSLYFAVYQLKKLLTLVPCNSIMARGPFAGFVAQKALQKNKKLLAAGVQVTVQARGLCAEEFRYASQQNKHSIMQKTVYNLKYRAFRKIEKKIFGAKTHVSFEAVSPALKTYLSNEFGTHGACVTIARNDLPDHVSEQDIAQWGGAARQELGIADDAVVYCYSGSHKPWQCATETIEYFVQKYKIDKKSFLLILSQDAQKFSTELALYGVPEIAYKVLSVKPDELLRYLSAADFGMLFRKKDVVNWVSRPTKMLEYQAVGLKVIHNDTIAWLVD